MNKLSNDVAQLKSDNSALKIQLEGLQTSRQQPPGLLAPRPAANSTDSASSGPLALAACNYIPTQGATSSKSEVPTSAKSGIKSYRDVVSAGLQSVELSAKVDSDGFKTVFHKKKPILATPIATTAKNKQRRQPLIGVRNCVSLPVVSKKERSKALCASRFSPEVTTVDIEESLKEQLSLKRLVCTRLKTKFNTYASFHVLVNEDDFPLVNNISVWPNGCLIAPFFGRLSPDQI
jgi:hypothetical protein